MSRGNKSKRQSNQLIKIQFYLMSLCLLFVLIFLLTIDIPVSFAPNAKFIGFEQLLKRNWVALSSLILVFVGLLCAFIIKRKWAGLSNPPHTIKTIKNENYEYLTFLTTYIIPLICVDLSEIRYICVLVVLLILIGFIFVKMDLYYGNPTLALMGYKLYRAEIEGADSPDGVILISKNQLTKGNEFKWIEVDRFVWVAKEICDNDS